ncbi:MAG: tetratricopeptide repeat protein [Chlorobi bacterium]|nr:tetratricopeptide repeat protein [Chlorobiota bacterium]
MKKLLLILLIFAVATSFSQPKEEFDLYFNAIFSGNYPNAKKILLKIKREYPENVKTKLIIANYYSVLFETSGGEDKYYNICKKYSDAAVTQLKKKKINTNNDVFRIISAKSILLKISVKKKEYLSAAKNMQSIIKYFEYATEHQENERMKYISGMYNYYVETAKEDYPIIYPILLFYPSGNKKEGLNSLKECTNSSDKKMQTRSLHQLALIYYKDEKNAALSKYYYKKLLKSYPKNLIWQTEYLNALKKFNLIDDYQKQKKIIKNILIKNTFLTEKQKKYFLRKAEISQVQ